MYPVAGVPIIYDPSSHTQRHFLKHDAAVTAMALHPDGNIVATGQAVRHVGADGGAGSAKVCVWDSTTMKPLAELGEEVHEHDIAAIAFSADGSHIASVGQDDQHTLAVWAWGRSSNGKAQKDGMVTGTRAGVEAGAEERKLVASIQTHEGAVNSLGFNPLDDSLVVVGMRFIRFYDLRESVLEEEDANLGAKGKLQSFTSLAFTAEGEAIVGCGDGSLYLFQDRHVQVRKQKRMRTCMCAQSRRKEQPVRGKKLARNMASSQPRGRCC